MSEIDYENIALGDLVTLEDGTVHLVRGIIDQPDQWVLQLHSGLDVRVPKPVASDDAP